MWRGLSITDFTWLFCQCGKHKSFLANILCTFVVSQILKVQWLTCLFFLSITYVWACAVNVCVISSGFRCSVCDSWTRCLGEIHLARRRLTPRLFIHTYLHQPYTVSPRLLAVEHNEFEPFKYYEGSTLLGTCWTKFPGARLSQYVMLAPVQVSVYFVALWWLKKETYAGDRLECCRSGVFCKGRSGMVQGLSPEGHQCCRGLGQILVRWLTNPRYEGPPLELGLQKFLSINVFFFYFIIIIFQDN